ncbi:hypothetical protein ABMA28_008408 [Loxostege sticticalis]|uniref:G-protein coupled receptors family 1 profile domain-containing protein n=1 Tax=Loxostege sticticalis TaxID=481309 RepID=A0ABD0SH36_LOXSC
MDVVSTLAPFFVDDDNNTTVLNATIPHRQHAKMFTTVIKVVYAIGIIGNATAIVALRWGERRVRNRKHLLLLTSLAANDLVALQVTYFLIRMALLVSWFWAAVLTCAPVFGLGLYYDESKQTCMRYREAVSTVDFAYAAFYVAFGTLLCLVLVYCNLAVIQALYSISAPRPGGQPVVRRVSRSSCRQRSLNSSGSKPSLHHNAATAEEVAFSRLMATLSVLFMICWLPQMVTSALYLGLGPPSWKKLTTLAKLSDMLMLLNYVLNPILYVLMRQRRTIYHTLVHCFMGSHKTSTESMTLKNSCCPQETLVVSDSSGAEMKPLRALPPYQNTPLVKIDD